MFSSWAVSEDITGIAKPKDVATPPITAQIIIMSII